MLRRTMADTGNRMDWSRTNVKFTIIAIAALLAAVGTARADGQAPTRQARACLAEAIYHESRGRGEKAAVAVAHVVVNRRESDDFPGSVCDVVQDGCQFSYRCDGKPETFSEARERVRAYRVAENVLTGDSRDPTRGALFFHAAEIDPGWFATRPRTAEIGGNVFYR